MITKREFVGIPQPWASKQWRTLESESQMKLRMSERSTPATANAAASGSRCEADVSSCAKADLSVDISDVTLQFYCIYGNFTDTIAWLFGQTGC